MKKSAELSFSFPHNRDWNQIVHVYLVNQWNGKPIESNEMMPEWFEIKKLPLDKMWEADRHWMPLVLNGKNVKASFVYNEKSQIISNELRCMEPVYITYFVHGTTTDNENGISTGWNQGKLSKLGIEQSKKLKSLIGDKGFDVVFCSDLKRAIDSSELSFGKYNLIIRDKRLRECNYGNLNGKKSEIVEPLAEKSIIKPFPNGESYKDVEKRIKSFLDDLLKKYSGKHIAIVAHRAPQLALDVIIKKKTWQQAFDEDWRKTKSWKPGWEYLLEK